MRRLDRYIGNSVLLAILAVLGVISSLALLFAFIDQLGDLDEGYQLQDALIYVGLTAPRRIYDLLPMSAMIGCLVGLGALASNSELTVMRAAGVSLVRIVWAVMKPLLLLMLLGIGVAQYLAPWSENMAQAHRSMAQSGDGAQGSKRGLWHRQGQEFIHINTVRTDGTLLGVTRYRFDEQQRLLETSFARKAEHRDGSWLLSDVRYTYLEKDSSRTAQVASQPWDAAFEPELLNTVIMEPDALPVTGLWNYASYMTEQGLNAGRYRLAFWTKVLQPVVTAMLVLMAISFIFGPLRSVTLGQRIFTGVVVGFVFKIAQDLLGPASLLFHFPPLLAVLFPAGVCAAVGLWLLRRAG